jgi:hypothetical protein
VERRDLGPRRSASVDSYLRETRAIAGVAVLALAGGVISDALGGRFWEGHALLGGLVSSLIVVMLSVAVVNEVLERRKRRRWSVLAQYVMFQLVRNARLIWTGVLELTRLMPSDGSPVSIDAAAGVVRDTPRLQAAIRELFGDGERRRRLHEEIARVVSHVDEVLGRWAAVMLNADAYAEIIDRHVELASEVGWLGDVLDHAEPTDDVGRRWKARSSVAVQMAGDIDGDWLADRLVVITQLAEELDRGTLELALRIVPVEWWAARLGTTVPPGVTLALLEAHAGRAGHPAQQRQRHQDHHQGNRQPGAGGHRHAGSAQGRGLAERLGDVAGLDQAAPCAHFPDSLLTRRSTRWTPRAPAATTSITPGTRVSPTTRVPGSASRT